MNRQMQAERQKRADVLQAEGEKQAAILRAEGDKQSAILQAEGRREAAFRDAEAAREREAKAEGKATESLSQAITDGSPQAVNYFIAQRYVDAFQKLAEAKNQKVILLPMEATGLLSSIGGVAELAKSALGGGPSGSQDPKGPWDQKPS